MRVKACAESAVLAPAWREESELVVRPGHTRFFLAVSLFARPRLPHTPTHSTHAHA